ncbi:penicillin binding protein [Agrobacterium sp. ATCC 31749]|nr:penicillin binding protein [Agrobacterium sp. ATCC 31749]
MPLPAAFIIVFFFLHLAMFSCSRQRGRRYFCVSTHSRRKTMACLCRNCLTRRLLAGQ